jgi:2-polyprenyl-6-methoxyphenol hydroxylase-like FAD-dependent oxidoreductase
MDGGIAPMADADVAIIGGGLAGSTAAAMLGRKGMSAVLIDPHSIYPTDFRAEKLDGSQVRALQRTGLADAVLPTATPDGGVWIARYGLVIDRRHSEQVGILYDTLVNTIRAEIPASVPLLEAKATDIDLGDECQRVVLSNGTELTARLVVMASGLNSGLRARLGMPRRELSKCHMIMLGFDVEPVGRPRFDFPALTYYAERPTDRAAFLTLFPIGRTMRANLCVYRELADPWLRQFRQAPEATLNALMPRLTRYTGAYAVSGVLKIRPADLYATSGYLRAGIVLVGDAFATSCPAAGTGTGKVFTDVERLCNVHIPRWLETTGMAVDKIAAFYSDRVKRASDADSLARAYRLRAVSTDTGLYGRARRLARFVVRAAMGRWSAVRALAEKARSRPEVPAGAPVIGKSA